MANTLQYTAATRNLRLDQTWDQLNNGKIKIYSGTIPTDADTALGAQVLLATLTFGATAFGAASGGVKTANAITQESDAPATGTATFFRCTNSAGTTTYAQGTVGATGSGEAMILPTTTINQHDAVPCTSFVVSEAA